ISNTYKHNSTVNTQLYHKIEKNLQLQRYAYLTRSSNTYESAIDDETPRQETSPSAILRRMRRMILPERVLGRPGANWMMSGRAIGPISLRTHETSSLRSSSDGCSP